MNVLSLFDGMGCGRIALERSGIKCDNYFASEIKPHAIKCSSTNFPDIEHLGDVTKIDPSTLPPIDILFAGFPCQDLSRMNKNRNGLDGAKSGLFYELMRIFTVIRPRYFLFENVIMENGMIWRINRAIGEITKFQCIKINSALISPQNRERYYWTNIPGDGDGFLGNGIKQPRDKGLRIKDILECPKKPTKLISEKPQTITIKIKKIKTDVDVKYFSGVVARLPGTYDTGTRVYGINGKAPCLCAKGDGSPQHILVEKSTARRFSVVEAERLQTVPNGYTTIVGRRKALDLLGDGWTIDVICHILKGLV